jgi:hypothetical protein
VRLALSGTLIQEQFENSRDFEKHLLVRRLRRQRSYENLLLSFASVVMTRPSFKPSGPTLASDMAYPTNFNPRFGNHHDISSPLVMPSEFQTQTFSAYPNPEQQAWTGYGGSAYPAVPLYEVRSQWESSLDDSVLNTQQQPDYSNAFAHYHAEQPNGVQGEAQVQLAATRTASPRPSTDKANRMMTRSAAMQGDGGRKHNLPEHRTAKSKRGATRKKGKNAVPAGVLDNVVPYSTKVDSEAVIRAAWEYVYRGVEERREAVLKKGGSAKRPLNKFMLYRKAHHDAIAKDPALQGNEAFFSSQCGKSWKKETAAMQAQFNEIYRVEKEQHLLAFPGYRYRPKEKSTSKRRRSADADSDRGAFRPSKKRRGTISSLLSADDNPEDTTWHTSQEGQRFRPVGEWSVSLRHHQNQPQQLYGFHQSEYDAASNSFGPGSYAPHMDNPGPGEYGAAYQQPGAYREQTQGGTGYPVSLPLPAPAFQLGPGFQPMQQVPGHYQFQYGTPESAPQLQRPTSTQPMQAQSNGPYDGSFLDPALDATANRYPTPLIGQGGADSEAAPKENDDDSCIYVASPPGQHEVPSAYLEQELAHGDQQAGDDGFLDASLSNWELREGDEDWQKLAVAAV